MPAPPMKALGVAAITQAGPVTAGAAWAAGLFTEVRRLVRGLSGAVTWIARLAGRRVVRGWSSGSGSRWRSRACA